MTFEQLKQILSAHSLLERVDIGASCEDWIVAQDGLPGKTRTFETAHS